MADPNGWVGPFQAVAELSLILRCFVAVMSLLCRCFRAVSPLISGCYLPLFFG
jgi:hypothetical protein